MAKRKRSGPAKRGSGPKVRERIDEILKRDDPADDKELRSLIEPRRAPGGRIVFVISGSEPDLRRVDIDDYVSARGLMDRKRPGKRRKYLAKKKDSSYSGPFILAEGDSWFEYPCAKDMIEWLNDEFAILSLAKAGDTWADVINQEGGYYSDNSPMGLFENMRSEKPDIVMLSIGGNDIVGDIEKLLERYSASRPRDQYINDDFELLLNYVMHNYVSFTRRIVAAGPKVIIHCYDYPRPAAAR